MQLHLCDWCERDIKGKKSASITAVADADDEGVGNVTDRFDLCPRCFGKWRRRMKEMTVAISKRFK